MKTELKTIKVKEETKARIDRFGFSMMKKKSTYDEIIDEAIRMAYRWNQNKNIVKKFKEDNLQSDEDPDTVSPQINLSSLRRQYSKSYSAD